MRQATSFGAWLRSRRKQQGLTQDELAQQVGCAAITIRKIESDDRRPSFEMAEKLAESLDLQGASLQAFLQVAAGEAPIHLLLGRMRTNLPQPLAPLIGRAEALEHAEGLFTRRGMRLLTLTGPGGIGKTALSLHLAARLAEQHPDGSYIVDLTTLSDSTMLPVAIAETIGLATPVAQRALSTVCEALREQALLLVLDNFEHLTTARTIVDAILRECMWVTIIITSREPLHLRQEAVVALEALAVPAPGAELALAEVAQASAIELFIARAQVGQPNFALTRQNAGAVIELCRRLDGIPLAIELVAAQCALYAPAEILERLGQRLPHLRDHLSDRPPRHQTVHGAISWGYELLAAAEQRLFAQLAVFIGGWTIAAAEAICDEESHDPSLNDPPPATVHLIFSLLTKSFIAQVQSPEGLVRFRMLTLLQDFASEQLRSLGLEEQTRRRHARYYAAFGRQLHTDPDAISLEALHAEYANMRAALRWALTNDESELAQHIDGGLEVFYQHTLATLSQTQAQNAQLEHLVAERTAELQAALHAVEQREQHLQAANAALLRASQAAEAAEVAKSQFLALLSHELNTMLTVSVGFSQIIPRYGALSERQEALLGRIHANSQQFIQLFSDLSDLLTLEQGPLALNSHACDARGLLEAAIAELSASHPSLTITCAWPEAMQPIRADAGRLEATVGHILRACAAWSSDTLLEIAATADVSGLNVSLSIQGGRLEPEDRLYLFDPFRAPNKHKQLLPLHQHVGLALGRQVIGLQGGGLRLESSGGGNSFIIELPWA